MFGFSLTTLIVTIFGTLSAVSTLLVISACVVSGRATRDSESMFNAYLQERKGVSDPELFAISQIQHRNFHAPAPQAKHRQYSGDEAEQGGVELDVPAEAEQVLSAVEDVQQTV